MTNTIAIVGSPTALGGHFGGMERGPAELRAAGLLDRLSSRPRLDTVTLIDHGDAPIDAGWAPDPDLVMKNRQRIIDYLPQLAAHVARALGNNGAQTAGADRRASSSLSGDANGVITAGAGARADAGTGPSARGAFAADAPTGIPGDAPTGIPGDAPTGIAREREESTRSSSAGPHANPDATFPLHTPRLLVLGGDCTSHSGAMAGLKRHAPDARLAIAWFDAHGDFNIPETTPSGNVWGMPFAMLCGRGDPGLVAACDGPTVLEEDAALLGAQVLDERESRMLAASAVAQFGAGMLAGSAGLAALEGWATAVAGRTDGMYVAFDLDAIDASEGVCVAMPEPDGLSVRTAVEALRILARTNRIVGLGPTATMRRPASPLDFDRHVDIVARLTEAALA